MIIALDQSYNFHNFLSLRIIRRKSHGFDNLAVDMIDRIFDHYAVAPILEPDIHLEVASFVPDLRGCFRVDRRFFVKENYMGFESSYKGGRWFTELQGVDSGPVRIRVQSNCIGHLAYPTIAPKGMLLMGLIRRGVLPLHGAAVAHPRVGGVLLPGRSGVGKTITSISLAKRGYGLLGDDYSLLKDQHLYSFAVPLNLRFTYNPEELHGKTFPASIKRELRWKKLLSLVTLKNVNLLTKIPIRYVFPNSLVDTVPLSSVYLLNHGPEFGVERGLGPAEIVRALETNMWFEMDELRKLILTYATCFPQSWLATFSQQLRTLIENNLRGIQCARIRVPVAYNEAVLAKVLTTIQRDMGDADYKA